MFVNACFHYCCSLLKLYYLLTFLLIKLSSELIFFPIKEKYLKELLMEPFKGAEYVRGGTVKFFAIPRPNIIFLKGLANERH